MPYIEATHLGPIPIEAFNCVLKCGNDTKGFEEELVCWSVLNLSLVAASVHSLHSSTVGLLTHTV